MIGVVVTAVMVSAVGLPSGAVVVFAVTEQDPPFLSQVAPALFVGVLAERAGHVS